MKKTFLLSIFTPFLGFAQLTINTFYDFTNGVSEDQYSVLLPTAGIDESPSGENAVWNFNQMEVQTSSYTRVLPTTPAEQAIYPDTYKVAITRTLTEDGETVSKLYIGDTPLMQTLITGFSTPELSLIYSDNISMDVFPTGYGGMTGGGNLTGTFEANGITGTFTGSSVASCDAYGLLTVNGTTKAADRIKITQELELFVLGENAGTLNQTIYYYYTFATPAAGPIFRSTSTHITLPAYSIDETRNIYEYYVTTLGTNEHAEKQAASIAPNPVKNILQFTTNVENTVITDAWGRIILQTNQANNIDVSHLSEGVYLVNITANSKTSSVKMIKQPTN